MSKKTWTEKLRLKMQAHEETPPDGLWEELNASLHSVVPQTNRTVVYRRWAAAAAVAALLTGGGLYWWNERLTPAGGITPVAENSVNDAVVKPAADVFADGEKEPVLMAQNVNALSAAPVRSKMQGAHGVSAPATRLPDAIQPIIQSEDVSENGLDSGHNEIRPTADNVSTETAPQNEKALLPQEEKPAKVPSQQAELHSEEDALLAKLLEQAYSSDKTKKDGYGEMNLFASNSVYGTDVFGPDINVPYMRRSAPQVRRESHHEQPLSFGLTFSFPVFNKLALTTGVVYTRQRSDFTYVSKTSQVTEKQTLHYVGIPVNVTTPLWGNNRFHTYALAGAQADFNFSARTERMGVTQNSEKDNVQFSATLGVGAQYDLLPFLGLYLEPSAKYYFDNQSDVSNSFKEDPFKFNLQMGLRFLLKNKK